MKLSPTQEEVLRKIREDEGRIVRVAGGFWTLPSITMEKRGRALVPAWSTAVRTVRALETKGLLKRTYTYGDEWKDPRQITDEGVAEVTTRRARTS